MQLLLSNIKLIITDSVFLIELVLSFLVNCATWSHWMRSCAAISQPTADHKLSSSMLMKSLVCACLLVIAVKASGPGGQPQLDQEGWQVFPPQTTGDGDVPQLGALPQQQVQGMTPSTLNQPQTLPLGRGRGRGRGVVFAGPSLSQASITADQYGPTTVPVQQPRATQFGRGEDPLVDSFGQLSINQRRDDRRRSFTGPGTRAQTVPFHPPPRRQSLLTTPSGSNTRAQTVPFPPPPRRQSLLTTPSTPSTNLRSEMYNPSPTYQPSHVQTYSGPSQKASEDSIRSGRYDQTLPRLRRHDQIKPVDLVAIRPTFGTQRVGSPPHKGSSRPGTTFTQDLNRPASLTTSGTYPQGVASGGAYKVSPFLDSSQQTYPQQYVAGQSQPYVAGHPQPLTDQQGGYTQDYPLVRDTADYKLPVTPSTVMLAKVHSDLIVPRRHTVKKIELNKWLKVHYQPEPNLLGEEQYEIESGVPYVVELYDPHWTGKTFVVVDKLRTILETRPSKTENYYDPDNTDRIDTYDPDTGYGRTVVDAGSHMFAVHVLKPSKSIPRNPIVYLRFNRLSTLKILRNKYLLVLSHFDSLDWPTVSSALNKKPLAEISRGELSDVIRAIKRTLSRGDDGIVLIGGSEEMETVGRDYAYLYVRNNRAEVHGRKNCMMLFKL